MLCNAAEYEENVYEIVYELALDTYPYTEYISAAKQRERGRGRGK